MKPLVPQHLLKQAFALIQAARKQVLRQTNSLMVFTYYQLGSLIVESEQRGNNKSSYGKETLIELSVQLNKRFGKGFSVDNLENMRLFYLAYKNKHPNFQISETPSRKSFVNAESPVIKGRNT